MTLPGPLTAEQGTTVHSQQQIASLPQPAKTRLLDAFQISSQDGTGLVTHTLYLKMY